MAATPRVNLDLADDAVRTAMDRFRKSGKKITSLPMSCLHFIKIWPDTGVGAGKTPYTDIEVRENHTGDRKGDPSTEPSVSTLRVQGKQVLVLDESGEYVVLD